MEEEEIAVEDITREVVADRMRSSINPAKVNWAVGMVLENALAVAGAGQHKFSMEVKDLTPAEFLEMAKLLRERDFYVYEDYQRQKALWGESAKLKIIGVQWVPDEY